MNLHIIGVPEEEREKGIENVFDEIMVENFPNLKKEIDIQVNPKNTHSKTYIIKMAKVKAKENSKGSKRKQGVI